MTAADSLRDAREKAFWALWRRWRDEPQRFAAELLDAFGRLDREHPADDAADLAAAVDAALARERELMARGDLSAGPGAPPDAWMTAWIEAHPAEFEARVAKRDRVSGGEVTSRPAPRRRTTTRKDGGS